jgi:hypothetical protein
MKWILVSVSSIGITISLVFFTMTDKFRPINSISPALVQSHSLQLGYYDVLSDKRERYVPHFEKVSNLLIFTLTDIEKKQIITKGKFIFKYGITQPKFSYQPTFNSELDGEWLINSSIDYIRNNQVKIYLLTHQGIQLAITGNGLIIINH